MSSPVGTAGTFHYELVLRNMSPSACSLDGFPGVSFLDSSGVELGPPATEGGAVARQLVTLAPGAEGYVQLAVTDPGIPPCGGTGSVSQVRVYPPGSLLSARVPAPPGMQVCTSPSTPTYTDSIVGPVTASPNPGYAK